MDKVNLRRSETLDGEIRWMISLFESLYPNKVWHIPRSRSVFQRRGDQLVFLDGRHSEYIACRHNFAKVGIEVVARTWPLCVVCQDEGCEFCPAVV